MVKRKVRFWVFAVLFGQMWLTTLGTRSTNGNKPTRVIEMKRSRWYVMSCSLLPLKSNLMTFPLMCQIMGIQQSLEKPKAGKQGCVQ